MARSGNETTDLDLAFVSPRMIKWALDRSPLARDFVAKKLKVRREDIERWERGESHPPFAKAIELANALHVPFGFFFLSSPPSISLPLPDFRGFHRQQKPSDDLMEVLNDVLIKQDWYRDYAKEYKFTPLKFVNSFKVSDSIFAVAANIRLTIGITQSLRQSVTGWTEYLSTLTRLADATGILVMRSGVVGNATRRKLKVEELQGFAIADRVAPIVFVNSVDFKASQTFTIAHELAHIWIGQTGIANADELGHTHNKIEGFCNRVAAEVLVPRDEFLTAWKYASGDAHARVQQIARQFWVSSLVSLRRAREFEEISDEQFETIKREEQKKRKLLTAGGGDYYRNIIARMGARLTGAVLSEVNNGHLPLRDAAQLLRMKVPTLVRFAETWK